MAESLSVNNVNRQIAREDILNRPTSLLNTGVQESEWFRCQVLDIRYKPNNQMINAEKVSSLIGCDIINNIFK